MAVAPLRRPLLHASYEVALQCAHTKVPYTMAEKLIKPCAINMVGCCRSQYLRTRVVDIFVLIDAFFQHHSISWDKDGSLCTDGAPAMMGHRSGFTALVKQRAPQVSTSHCFLHRHALATRTLPIVFKVVLDTAVRVVNFRRRGSSMNHRLFKACFNELGTEHQVLLFHTEVRWLSRGRVLARVSEQHGEISNIPTRSPKYCSKRSR